MEISSPTGLLSNLSGPNLRQMVDTWRTGQVLQATVVARPAPDTVQLKINDILVIAKGQLPVQLPAAATLKLEVVSVTAPVTLRAQLQPPPADPVANALRQALPRQLPLPPLLANLASVAQPNSPVAAVLPPAVSERIRALIDKLPSPAQVSSPTGLQQAVRDSGLMFERKLLDPRASPTQHRAEIDRDFKANVARLYEALQQSAKPGAGEHKAATPAAPGSAPAALRLPLGAGPLGAPPTDTQSASEATAPTAPSRAPAAPLPLAAERDAFSSAPPPLKHAPVLPQGQVPATLSAALPVVEILRTLAEQTEGALARVTVSQLAHVPDLEQPLLQTTLELPIRRDQGVDLVSVRFEQDRGRRPDSGGQPSWSVTLSFDFEETGPLQAHLRVYGKQVQCNFTAERATTVALVERHVPLLKNTMSQVGLDVSDIHCHLGRPSTAPRGPRGPSLLDVQA